MNKISSLKQAVAATLSHLIQSCYPDPIFQGESFTSMSHVTHNEVRNIHVVQNLVSWFHTYIFDQTLPICFSVALLTCRLLKAFFRQNLRQQQSYSFWKNIHLILAFRQITGPFPTSTISQKFLNIYSYSVSTLIFQHLQTLMPCSLHTAYSTETALNQRNCSQSETALNW